VRRLSAVLDREESIGETYVGVTDIPSFAKLHEYGRCDLRWNGGIGVLGSSLLAHFVYFISLTLRNNGLVGGCPCDTV
jgi:hypothetical protein